MIGQYWLTDCNRCTTLKENVKKKKGNRIGGNKGRGGVLCTFYSIFYVNLKLFQKNKAY